MVELVLRVPVLSMAHFDSSIQLKQVYNCKNKDVDWFTLTAEIKSVLRSTW